MKSFCLYSLGTVLWNVLSYKVRKINNFKVFKWEFKIIYKIVVIFINFFTFTILIQKYINEF